MARPQKNPHTREALLEKGESLLATQGYHGTGLKQILDAVQVPKGSFYNYFDSKEQYVAEMIEYYTQKLIEFFEDALSKRDDNELEKIRFVYLELINMHMETQDFGGCLVGNLAAEVGSSSELCRLSLKAAISNWESRFHALLGSGQRKGLIRQDMNVEELADLFWSAWEGGLLRTKIDGNADKLERLVNNLVQILKAT